MGITKEERWLEGGYREVHAFIINNTERHLHYERSASFGLPVMKVFLAISFSGAA
ncbi:MAG: hypothetical protein ACREIJ_04800 [Nitrospiraceae bacterium]